MAEFYKNGVVKGSLLLEYIREPDGSIWEPVFCHTNPTSYLFSSSDSFSTGVVRSQNLFFNFNVCKELTSWEFLCIQKATASSDTIKIRWRQNKSPFNASWTDVNPSAVTRITTSGYANNSTYGGGFYVHNGNNYITLANTSNGNWWGATGCWTPYEGGIPGYNGTVVTTGTMTAFVRIDGTNVTPKTKVYPSTGIIVANNLVKI